MENPLEYIVKKFNVNIDEKSPIAIPDTNRETLARLFNELGFRKGAEIGVKEGVYSEILLLANPELKLWGIDPWTSYDSSKHYRKQKYLDENYKTAIEKMSPYKNYTFVKKSSMNAVHEFEDGSLDFVYIDADHEYMHVVQDIAEWSKKVRTGGIVSGHDYHRSSDEKTFMHVVYAVNGYVQAYKIKPWFLLGRREKVEGELRDKERSWFWIKQ